MGNQDEAAGKNGAADGEAGDAPTSGQQPAAQGPKSGVPSASQPPAADAPAEEPAKELTPLEAAEKRVKELEEKVASAQSEAKGNHNKMLRVAADFDNFRKRAAREADEARARGQQNAVMKLLPVFDNLERATLHVDASADVKSLSDGLRMVMKQFGEALGKLGIERVQAVGQPFDPMLHESIQYDHHATIAAGLVAQELQPGYRQGESLLRPALVVVSKGPKPDEEPKPAEEPQAEEAKPADDKPGDAS
jgi:molecular chaperone GrpE